MWSGLAVLSSYKPNMYLKPGNISDTLNFMAANLNLVIVHRYCLIVQLPIITALLEKILGIISTECFIRKFC